MGGSLDILLPSLRMSGGTYEVIGLAKAARAAGKQVRIVSIWEVTDSARLDVNVVSLNGRIPALRALVLMQIPILMLRFWWLQARSETRGATWLFTHYATLPFALLVPRRRRMVFIQDLEWKFVAGRKSDVLKRIIVFFYRRMDLIFANRYLAEALRALGLEGRLIPIWAEERFLPEPSGATRDIDVLMLVRTGEMKRADLYEAAVDRLREKLPNARLAVITTSERIGAEMAAKVDEVHFAVSRDEMAALYARSKIFLFLSEHEGFGLPPLEAMGTGCVPLCRDAGGTGNYMTGALAELVFSRDVPVQALVDRLAALIVDEHALAGYRAAGREIFRSGLAAKQSGLAQFCALV